MFQDLDMFRLSSAMAAHAGQRQGVIAQNIANADTPGYKARDISPFADIVRGEGLSALRATRPRHLDAPDDRIATARVREEHVANSPNGNSVGLEEEMLRAVEVRRQHDRALAIYRNGLSILRTSLGRG